MPFEAAFAFDAALDLEPDAALIDEWLLPELDFDCEPEEDFD